MMTTSRRMGGIKRPGAGAPIIHGAAEAAQRLAAQSVKQPGSDLEEPVARRFANVTGVGQTEVDTKVKAKVKAKVETEPVDTKVKAKVKAKVNTKVDTKVKTEVKKVETKVKIEVKTEPVDQSVWTVSGLLANPELRPELFPRSNSKAFMNAVRRIMGADGMLVTDEEVAQGGETHEEATDRFFEANEQLVTQLLEVHDSWYSTSGRLLPAEMRGKLITAATTLSLPWIGSWVIGQSVMQRVLNKDVLLMADFVPPPSMLAWTETLRGFTPEQVEAIKATKGIASDLGAVAEAIATVIASAADHLVPTRFGVVEVSNLERVVTVALRDGGYGIQIVRQARVKDGVINAGTILNLTPMSRVMSFYELRFADDVIEVKVESNTLDTVL